MGGRKLYSAHNVRTLAVFFLCWRPLGLALSIGKNYYSSSHKDNDMALTFSGSFSKKGQVGNGFVFPEYKVSF